MERIKVMKDIGIFGTFITLKTLISSLSVFVGLYTIMILLHKILSWSSREARIVGEKIRLQEIGFILSFTLWWFLLDLPPFPAQVILVKGAWCSLVFFAFMLVLDLLNYLFFDFYSPVVKKVRIPQIISNLIRALYFIGTILFILGGVLNMDIRPFLTGSAILTAIIGLALQDVLGNLFSGLALHISRPFDIGHWIKVSSLEGVVVKIDWRATTIKTREEDYICIANSQLSKEEVINYSVPTVLHGVYVDVGVRYEYPPNKVKRILAEAALSTEGVNKKMYPDIFLTKYNDFSIDYKMRFYIDDYTKAPAIRSRVMEKIWYAFKRNNIEIPFPIRDIYIKKEKEKFSQEELMYILSKIDFLQGLNSQELLDVAKRLRPVLYAAGEEIIRQGDTGDTFFIINRGRVNVIARNQEGDVFLTRELSDGDFFGEISVLTGEPRTASVKAITDVELFVLSKDDFEIILKKYPDLDRRISEKIAERQRHTFEQMELAKQESSEEEAKVKAHRKVESLSQQILTKIRKFFSLQ